MFKLDGLGPLLIMVDFEWALRACLLKGYSFGCLGFSSLNLFLISSKLLVYGELHCLTSLFETTTSVGFCCIISASNLWLWSSFSLIDGSIKSLLLIVRRCFSGTTIHGSYPLANPSISAEFAAPCLGVAVCLVGVNPFNSTANPKLSSPCVPSGRSVGQFSWPCLNLHTNSK